MQAAMCGLVGYCSSRIRGCLNSPTSCSRHSSLFSFITAMLPTTYYLTSFLGGGGGGGSRRGMTGRIMLPKDES